MARTVRALAIVVLAALAASSLAGDPVPRPISGFLRGRPEWVFTFDYDRPEREIAWALGQIGPDATVATPLLEEWKTKGDRITRVPAAQALRRIKTKK